MLFCTVKTEQTRVWQQQVPQDGLPKINVILGGDITEF